MKFLEGLLQWFRPQLQLLIAKVFSDLLQKLYVKDPVKHETLLAILYPPVDVQLEDLVKESKGELDDAVVAGLKAGIEGSAELSGITLQNLDSGKPND